MATVGAIDDVHRLGARPRLVAQVVVGAAIGGILGGSRGAVVGSLVMPATVNATNFMDGINGITGASVITWAWTHRRALPGSRAYECPFSVPSAVGGAAAGFLPHNMPSATLFLGDSGSYLFGGAIGATLIADLTDPRGVRWRRLLSAHSPVVVYFADTGSTLVRRALRGANLAEAHREHFYQRLQQAGPYPHWAVTLVFTAVEIAAAIGIQAARIHRRRA